MRQLLQKVFDLIRRVARTSVELCSRIILMLRSVNIDLPRAVILCVTLQLIVAISVLIVLYKPSAAPAQPREVGVAPLDPAPAAAAVE